MKKHILVFFFLFCGTGIYPVYAQSMSEDAVRGGVVWEQMIAKERTCQDASEGDYISLGSYFTSLFSGTPYGTLDGLIQSHIGFNEKQKLISALGKRFSGCDVAAPFPEKVLAFSPMSSMPREYDHSLLVILQLVVVSWIAFAVVSIVVAFKLLIHCFESYFLTLHQKKQQIHVVPFQETQKATLPKTRKKKSAPRKKKKTLL